MLILPVACLVALCWLSSCRGEKGAPGQKPAESAVESEVKPEVKKEPRITVGNVALSLPAPEGFVSVAPESLAKGGLPPGGDEGGVLLCAFARKNSIGPKNAPPSAGEQATAEERGTPEPRFADAAESGISVAEFDILRVDTLEKWLHSNFSAGSFDALKARLQNNSVVCDARTVAYFTEASRAGLAGLPAYTYNLGLAGQGGRQISFACIVKNTGAEGEALFICTVKTLLYRDGKILRLEYSRRIAEFTEILPAVEAYLSYVGSLESPGDEAASHKAAPAAGTSPLSLSSASFFSRSEDVLGLYGAYRRNSY
jgi:hypothetical protein